MITGEHTHIRTTDADDAAALHRFYDMTRPRSALLDKKREPLMPAVSELREMLAHREAAKDAFYTVEDRTGLVKGFCSLRGMSHETGFGEITMLFYDDAHFAGPMAKEVFAFLEARGFDRLHLNKLVAHCLDVETAWRDALLARGFQSNGVQRDVFYGQGRWHDLEAFSRMARDRS